jgi:hypothetical protein
VREHSVVKEQKQKKKKSKIKTNKNAGLKRIILKNVKKQRGF